jgi:hypothetical protein
MIPYFKYSTVKWTDNLSVSTLYVIYSDTDFFQVFLILVNKMSILKEFSFYILVEFEKQFITTSINK